MIEANMTEGRRLKAFMVAPVALDSLVRGGIRTVRVESLIPPSAKFFTAYMNQRRNCFIVIYEDDSFPLLEEGSEIPFVPSPTVEVFEITDAIRDELTAAIRGI